MTHDQQPKWSVGRRRPGGADRGDRARRRRHRDRAGREAAAAADNRTTALLAGSVTALDDARRLGALPRRTPRRCARMRIVDDTARLLRAPEVALRCRARSGLRRSATISRTGICLRALESRAAGACRRSRSSLTRPRRSRVGDGRRRRSRSSGGGAVTARLAIGADGRRSLCRAAAGIETDAPELSADRARPSISPTRRPHRRHLDRIPHRDRPVHAGAAAGPALEPGVCGRSGRGAAPAGAGR